MTDLADALADALVVIGNMASVMNACEPNIMQPQKLEKWMALRIMVALSLFQEELDELHRTRDLP